MPFRDVIGHRRIVELLTRSMAGDSLPPSLIFAGPTGIGKRLIAMSVAQALNCLSPRAVEISRFTESRADQDPAPVAVRPAPRTPHPHPAPGTVHPAPGTSHLAPLWDSCGVCAACTRIARGVHPDVLVVEPGDNGAIKVEQARDVVERAAYRPFEGHRRVVIIDQADALLSAAQNALLKTLEEPPSLSMFILVTARPDVLLATVRSRCPKLTFRPLSPRELAAALVARGRPETEALAVAATADGSIGRALEATADSFVEARETAGRVLMQAAATADPSRRLDAAKSLVGQAGSSGAADRERLAVQLRAMASLVRDVELLASRGDAAALANPDVRSLLDRLIAAFQGDRGIRAFRAIDQALEALDRNAGVKIVADWLVLAL